MHRVWRQAPSARGMPRICQRTWSEDLQEVRGTARCRGCCGRTRERRDQPPQLRLGDTPDPETTGPQFLKPLAAGRLASPPQLCLVYAAPSAFAPRPLCAAAIRLRPAAEMVLFGFALCFAHRAFCARLILRRPAADIVRAPLELLPNAASASSMRWSCCCTCTRSFFNCWTTADMFCIGTPAE